MAVKRERRVFRFGPYALDPDERELRRGGERVHIQSKPLALLLYLLEHSGRVVSHEELLKAVWPGVRVEAGALKSAIHGLRRTLGASEDDASAEESDSDPGWIVSVHGQGYRFRAVELEVVHAVAQRPVAAASDFVDREDEMHALREVCHAALGGARQIVLLAGPPGIGKTRTASELAREAEALGFETHVGRTHEGEGAPPFWPWAQIVQSWGRAHGAAQLEGLAGADGQASDLLGLAPEGAAPARSYAPADQLRFRTLERVSAFLERAARQRPQLLILDDVHRADSGSIELLIFVAQHLVRAPLLIVATHRPLLPGHALGRVLREPGSISLALGGLVRSSVERILALQLGSAPPELIDRIHAASGGNPMFVYELVRSLAVQQTRDAALPSRVHDAVWARICECSPACLELLRMASVGAELSLPILRRALGSELAGAELLDVLEEAETNDLYASSGGSCRFVHGIVREVLYERLNPTERMQLHWQVGEAIEALETGSRAERLAALAHHFVASAPLGRAERAVEYATRAGDSARDLCAFREAADAYRGALRALGFGARAEPAQESSLLAELGDALGYAGAPIAEFQQAFTRALELARAAGLSHIVVDAAERCARHMDDRGCFIPFGPAPDTRLTQTLRSALEEVRGAPEVTGNAPLRGRVCLALSNVLFALEREDEAAAELASAIEIARSSEDPTLRGGLLLRECSSLFDRLEERHALPRAVLERAVRSQSLRLEVEANWISLFCASERGDRSACDLAASELERLARATGLPIARHYTQMWRTFRALLEGPVSHAHEQGRLLVSERTIEWTPQWTFFLIAQQTWWLSILGGGAERLLAQAESFASTQARTPESNAILPRLYAECGRLDDARRTLPELPVRRPGFGSGERWFLSCAVQAECCAMLGERERALALYTQLQPYAARMVLALPICLGPLTRQLGSLAALLGLWTEAESHFAQAAAAAQAFRAPVLTALVDADRALAFRTHPDRRERRRNEQLLASAERAAGALGLAGLAARLSRA